MEPEWKADNHEEPGVQTGRVLALVFGFLAFVVILVGGLKIYYGTVLRARTVEISVRDFPAPRLQPNATQDWANFHKAQIEDLSATAQAGPSQTSKRLPIEQAMASVVARGAQAYDPVDGTPESGQVLANGAAMDGTPRSVPAPDVAPYGAQQ